MNCIDHSTDQSTQDHMMISSDSTNRRRRRRPKRSIGSGSKHVVDTHDQWYDETYQLLSSGCVTPLEHDAHTSSISNCKSLLQVPVLLYERELYGRRGNDHQRRTTTSWMNHMISDTTKDADKGGGDVLHYCTRNYCQQALKFCHLRASIMDAVLGIEHHGNYVVAIGKTCGGDHTTNQLSLRLCGIPSSKNPSMSVAPLLLSIPLTEPKRTDNRDDESNSPYNNWWQFSPESCPIRVWLSTNELFGACMYRTMQSGRNPTATVVLFPLPRAISLPENGYVVYRRNHVLVPSQSKQDISPINDCNFLVRAPFFPNRNPSAIEERTHWICDSTTKCSATNIFIVDEVDGFRLTWIQGSLWNENENHRQSVVPIWEHLEMESSGPKTSENHQQEKANVVRATKESQIVIPLGCDDWEPMFNNLANGELHEYSIEQCGPVTPQFTIAFTAFFSVASLLHDILTRRPTLVSPRYCSRTATLPIFTYNLIHVDDGRIADVFLVFAVGPAGKGCRGVFIDIDLLTQDYREIEWVKHGACDTPPPTCAYRSYERRKSQAGISSIQGMTNEPLFDILYPDCVTMDNKAIRRQVTVEILSARSAPVSISYQ